MENIVKVSIGGLHFTLGKEGYERLSRYLESIEQHYLSLEGGEEIVEGIEERVAELLLERTPHDTLVSDRSISEVISLLGSIEDIEGEGAQFNSQKEGVRSEESSKSRGEYKSKGVKRRLYRDPFDRVLAGVCSGLGAYLGVSSLVIRALFLLLALGISLFGVIKVGSFSFMFLFYIVLWIVMPEARSVEERHAMRGEPFTLASLEESRRGEWRYRGRRERRTSGARARHERRASSGMSSEDRSTLAMIGSVVVKVVGALFVLTSIILLGLILLFIFGIELFSGIVFVKLINYLQLGISNLLLYKVVSLLLILLPSLILLYFGLKLAFNLRIPRVRLGLILFTFWFLSLLSFSFLTVKASTPYWNSASSGSELPLALASDTLYINFVGEEPAPKKGLYWNGDYSSYKLGWIDEKRERVALFPTLKIVRQREAADLKLKYETSSFGRNYFDALAEAEALIPTFSLDDRSLTIMPSYYSRENKWGGTIQEIALYLPKGVTVIVEEPLPHKFKGKKSKLLLP